MRIDRFMSAEALGHLGDILILVGTDDTILDVNDAAIETYGYPREEFVGLPIRALAPTLDIGPLSRAIEESGPRGLFFETEHVRKDRSRFPCEVRAVSVMEGGDRARLSVVRDISQRKDVEVSLRRSQERFDNISATIPGVLYEYAVHPNGESEFVYFGPGCVEVLEIASAELLRDGRAFWDLVHPDDLDRVLREDDSVDGEGTTFAVDFRIITPSGSLKWVHMASRQLPSRFGMPDVWCGIILDITARKEAEEKLRQRDLEMARLNEELARLAATDPLTDLANRRQFHLALQMGISAAERHDMPLSVATFDLDGLKAVNDTRGHAAGDAVLSEFARLLAAECRVEDLAGRLGGDEFALLLPSIDLDGATAVARRVVTAVRERPALARAEVRVSVGVARWEAGEREDDTMRRADQALYAAKRLGGDTVVSSGLEERRPQDSIDVNG